MNDLIKSVLPWLGTALGGPLGGAAATAIGNAMGLADKTVENVKNVLESMNPEQLETLKTADYDFQLKMAGMGYTSVKDLAELETRNIEAINKTMVAEAGAEHWPSYSWRPFNGFLLGITIFGTYFVLPLMKITPPSIPEAVWLTWGGILGVASFFRGKAEADPRIPPKIQIPANHNVVTKVLGQG